MIQINREKLEFNLPPCVNVSLLPSQHRDAEVAQYKLKWVGRTFPAKPINKHWDLPPPFTRNFLEQTSRNLLRQFICLSQFITQTNEISAATLMQCLDCNSNYFVFSAIQLRPMLMEMQLKSWTRICWRRNSLTSRRGFATSTSRVDLCNTSRERLIYGRSNRVSDTYILISSQIEVLLPTQTLDGESRFSHAEELSLRATFGEPVTLLQPPRKTRQKPFWWWRLTRCRLMSHLASQNPSESPSGFMQTLFRALITSAMMWQISA